MKISLAQEPWEQSGIGIQMNRANHHVLTCKIEHNLNVMVCSIDLKYYEILQFKFLLVFLSVTFDHYNSW